MKKHWAEVACVSRGVRIGPGGGVGVLLPNRLEGRDGKPLGAS